jgi:lysozyme
MIDHLIKQLRRDEGVRLKPYKDTVGKLTIGIGRNLDDVGISNVEADTLLKNDVTRAMADLDKHLPWWATLDDARRGVLVNMAFNLGIHGLLGFKNTLRMIETGRYNDAADNMLQSKWATQVGVRAQRLATQMRTGAWQ